MVTAFIWGSIIRLLSLVRPLDLLKSVYLSIKSITMKGFSPKQIHVGFLRSQNGLHVLSFNVTRQEVVKVVSSYLNSIDHISIEMYEYLLCEDNSSFHKWKSKHAGLAVYAVLRNGESNKFQTDAFAVFFSKEEAEKCILDARKRYNDHFWIARYLNSACFSMYANKPVIANTQ